MKHILYLILTLLLVSPAWGAVSIHVEWGYAAPAFPAVTGFKLYQEGVYACQTTTPTATAMDCSVSIVKSSTNYTLTAVFGDGSESPHSAPFAFVYKPMLPAPTELKVTAN
jgi:hypothetical protein